MTEMIEPMAAQIDQQRLAQELVEQARAEGVELVGASGLLTRLTKSVLETCGCRTGHPRPATWVYSWINPPSRSRRRRLSGDCDAGGGSDLSGAALLH